MWARDRISIEECEKASEGLEEGPVGEKTDALVAVNAAGPVRSQISAGKAELRTLALRQFLLRVRLIELDGCSVYLRGKKHHNQRVTISVKGASRCTADVVDIQRLTSPGHKQTQATVSDFRQIER